MTTLIFTSSFSFCLFLTLCNSLTLLFILLINVVSQLFSMFFAVATAIYTSNFCFYFQICNSLTLCSFCSLTMLFLCSCLGFVYCRSHTNIRAASAVISNSCKCYCSVFSCVQKKYVILRVFYSKLLLWVILEGSTTMELVFDDAYLDLCPGQVLEAVCGGTHGCK